MLLIYPDSNSLSDRRMTGDGSRDLISALQSGVVEVRLSPVVLAEVTRQTRQDAASTTRALSRSIRTLKHHYPDHDSTRVSNEAEALISSIMANDAKPLAPLLASAACATEDYPPVSAKALVERELLKRRPTLLSADKSVGLRDQVIWDGCLQILQRGDQHHVIFVTQDNGFLKDGKLHPDLVEECGGSERIRVVASLAEAVVEAKIYRDIYSDREAKLSRAVLEYVESLKGREWDSTVGNIDHAPTPDPMVAAYVDEVEPTLVESVSDGSPAIVIVEGSIWLGGQVNPQYWADPDDYFSGELDTVLDPEGDVAFVFRTGLRVEASVSFDAGPDGLSTNSVTVDHVSMEWYY